jgi:peptide deformylase
MIVPVYLYGSPILRQVCAEVSPTTPYITKLIADLKETMANAEGVGLAAPQVGKALRIFVADGNLLAEKYPEGKDFVHTFINPRIVEEAGNKWTYSEGCLSIPNIHEDVERLSRVRLQYMDEAFVEHCEWFEGVCARIIQHECDHLDGKNYIDRLSPLRRQLLKSKLVRISKGNTDCNYPVRILKQK